MRALIFANGNFEEPASLLDDIKAHDLIIAADGGAQHCLNKGLEPAVVIGDFDSIDASLVEEYKKLNVQFILFPRDKNETDLELALRYAVGKGVDQIVLFGLLGGRMDQSLANVLLLTRDEWRHVDLVVSQGADIAYLLNGEKIIQLQGNPGDIVSLVPLSEIVNGVTTYGLRWKLDAAKLDFGHTLSVSNKLTGYSAWVKIQSGKLLLFHLKRPVQEREI